MSQPLDSDLYPEPNGIDPAKFLRAAMNWHFSPDTGSKFWLDRAKALEFDPRSDVNSFDDLTLFPNVIDELRNVPVEDLVPRGYCGHAEVAKIFESGGTTGAPKRIAYLRDWMEHHRHWHSSRLDANEIPRNVNWLGIIPTGPHMVGDLFAMHARNRGGVAFTIDMDPRWVKKLIANGRAVEASAYVDHLVEQAEFVLRTQNVGVLSATPAILERMGRSDELVQLINDKVQAIVWGGMHMDPDTRHLLRTEVFPEIPLCGLYGSTMILGTATERPSSASDEPCVFDSFSPYITFSVVNPNTLQRVAVGDRGQIVMNHVSKAAFFPNNLERDEATRVAPPDGHIGDSVADVAPLPAVGGAAVIEGVY